MLKYIFPIIVLFSILLIGELFVRLVKGPPAAFLYGGSWRDKQSDFNVLYGTTNHRRTTCSDLTNKRTRKIAVIGDSFVFGTGVRDCMDCVSLLNQGKKDFFFENYGIIGAGTAEYDIIIRDFVDDSYFGVILLFYGNDLTVLSEPHGYFSRLADNLSVFSLLRRAKRKYIVIKELSKTGGAPYNNVLEILNGNKDSFVSNVNPNENSIEMFKMKFGKLIERLKKRNIKNIYVSMVPEGHIVSKKLRNFIIDSGGNVSAFEQPGKSYKLIKDLAKQHGIIFIDTFESFLEQGDEAYFPHDLHWSENGHKIMSQLIMDKVMPYMELSKSIEN